MLPRFATLCGQIVEPFSCVPLNQMPLLPNQATALTTKVNFLLGDLCEQSVLWQLRIWQREIRPLESLTLVFIDFPLSSPTIHYSSR